VVLVLSDIALQMLLQLLLMLLLVLGMLLLVLLQGVEGNVTHLSVRPLRRRLTNGHGTDCVSIATCRQRLGRNHGGGVRTDGGGVGSCGIHTGI